MKIDQVVTLANDKDYLLLLESENTEERYFLSVLLKDNEPTQEYAVLKEVIQDGEMYCQKINNPVVLNQLLEDYQVQYNEMYKAD